MQILHAVEQLQGMYQRRTSQTVLSALESQAAVVLLGPRQVGKTTLALEIAGQRPSVYLDLERAADRQILTEPDLYLDEQVGKLVILDEVQQMPDLFKNLRGRSTCGGAKEPALGSSFSWGLLRMYCSINRRSPSPGGFAISRCGLSYWTK